MDDLLPQLNPVIFWMSNCLEMHHYLQNNISRYIEDKESLDDTITDEELVVCLEEVVMYAFQQTVYHLTKVKISFFCPCSIPEANTPHEIVVKYDFFNNADSLFCYKICKPL